ncbi:Uncharacterised protein [Mycobacteroides abscessus subsp. abscessus]|uniref:hypothetical protein n=1 Tax=Mycobacteroides abscessus TaxID=36809 RepID=UPI0009A5A649|nr:hypothetical protein [Mycobacteroides abscessus]SLI19865.1 Uncharacterised protein [Mycobacteroides abscessus subsp. abscessus]
MDKDAVDALASTLEGEHDWSLRSSNPAVRPRETKAMNVSELETVKAALALLEVHGHTDAAEAVKDALVSEFGKIADSLRESSPQ